MGATTTLSGRHLAAFSSMARTDAELDGGYWTRMSPCRKRLTWISGGMGCRYGPVAMSQGEYGPDVGGTLLYGDP